MIRFFAGSGKDQEGDFCSALLALFALLALLEDEKRMRLAKLFKTESLTTYLPQVPS